MITGKKSVKFLWSWRNHWKTRDDHCGRFIPVRDWN